MDKKQPNKWGVYADLDCERLAIPLGKKHKSGLLISVVCASDGLWRFGFSCAIKTSGQTSPVSDNGLTFKIREEAIVAGINKLSAIVSAHSGLTKTETKIYLDALEKFSLEFPMSGEAPEQSEPEPEQKHPLQVEKPRPRKPGYIFGWGKYEQPYELKNAWDELMKDPKALIG